MNVDLTSNYTSSKQLYTAQTGATGNENHSLMIRDEHTPLNVDNKSIFEPVWSYMLGIDIGLNIINSKAQELSIYPNPTSKNLLISSRFKIKQIRIYDLQGKLVLSFKNTVQIIDVSSLNNGLYVLKIIDENNNIQTKKFSKIY